MSDLQGAVSTKLDGVKSDLNTKVSGVVPTGLSKPHLPSKPGDAKKSAAAVVEVGTVREIRVKIVIAVAGIMLCGFVFGMM
ncbi:hypothetical protein QBC38DRAFT_455316 [Podospora fimiseda]|uniref:Uncharacterized protein n=1 Tax=Podospora fimiseda TaxID=252190 RepID=A0AAN7GUN9_9PEZI|nr:hypothetical protein QBC38DRAFT_455316 [Podospora fimiseda]